MPYIACTAHRPHASGQWGTHRALFDLELSIIFVSRNNSFVNNEQCLSIRNGVKLVDIIA
jgi:hypothetical protein